MAPSPLVTLFFVGWTHILLYGVNAVLFIVGMYLLRQRKAREGTMFLVVSSSVLFALATVSAIISTSLVVGEYLSIPLPGTSPTSINLQAWSIIEFVLFGLIDLTAFIILVYRSFHIWDRRYLVIVVPVLLFLGASALYYYELHQYLITQQFVTAGSPAGLITTTFVYTTTELSVDTVSHALLTYLIARRIWTLKTCLQDLGHEGIAGTLPQKYNSIIAITLESGMIIPTFTIIFTVFNVINAKTGAHGDVTAILSTIMPQIYALAPLIIMMRVTLGLTVERYNAGNPTILSSLSFGARTSQGRGSLPPALNVHRDGSVPVSGTSPSDLQDLEQNLVSKGQAI